MDKRIIPCLDIQNGRVVKGRKFTEINDVADPVLLAKDYDRARADALFLLDITGSNREQFLAIAKSITASISTPLYVGGGIRTKGDVAAVLDTGAQKVAITSAAIQNPRLLTNLVREYGGEKIILSIDAKQVAEGKWHAFIFGGKQDSGLDAVEWARQGEQAGVSEVLLNSIDADGVKNGYDLPLIHAVASAIKVPVIASGGAGEMEHFKKAFSIGRASAALAASVFHYHDIPIDDLKKYLAEGL